MASSVERDVVDRRVVLAMGDGRHPLGEGCEDRGRAADGVGFERFAAGKHEHDERAGQVFAQQNGGDDRDAGQEIGAKLPSASLTSSSQTSGMPPSARATHSGRFCTVAETEVPNRSTRCTAIATTPERQSRPAYGGSASHVTWLTSDIARQPAMPPHILFDAKIFQHPRFARRTEPRRQRASLKS